MHCTEPVTLLHADVGICRCEGNGCAYKEDSKADIHTAKELCGRWLALQRVWTHVAASVPPGLWSNREAASTENLACMLKQHGLSSLPINEASQ